RQKEIRTEIQSSKQKALELTQLAQQIRNSANNDQALSNATLSTFGGLGIFEGLSAADKEKMHKTAAELEKQAGELQIQADESNSELCNCDSEESSIRQMIEEEERKLQLGLDEQ